MNIEEIISLDEKYYMNTFGKRTPVCFDHGSGINLYDKNGKEYKDFFSGIAVCSLGHCHPNLLKAILEQSKKLIHCSNLYYNEPQARLAKTLVEKTCFDRVFFTNSGAEANEGAIKLARAFFHKQGKPWKNEVITLKESFHGRTLTTITATGQPKYQQYFSPLTPGFLYAERNNFDELASLVSDNTCAILLEPIQGESGVHPMDVDYVNKVRKLCDKNNILLIFDEVQTGMGRTGKLFAYEHLGAEPDIMTLAKGIAGGFPMGALLAKEHVAKAFEPGDHGTTFGGGPLACAAALATLETIIEENLVSNAAAVGAHLMELLEKTATETGKIQDVRGAGLMIGIEFSSDIAVDVKNKLFEKGWLVGSVGKNILRILPPLIVSSEDADGFAEALRSVLSVL